MTFCLICRCKFGGEASPYRACGSGGLSNSLGRANCVQNTGSAFAVPRPSPSFPSLAVHSPASRRLQYAYCKQREAGQGPGKENSSAWCECLPEQQDLSFSSVVFYKSTALLHYYCVAGNKMGSKSPINQKKCIVVNALLLYSK